MDGLGRALLAGDPAWRALARDVLARAVELADERDVRRARMLLGG